MDTLKLVTELRSGDMVDLQDDRFADPNHHPAFESEYQTVIEVEHETPNCVAVAFDGFDTVGFPPDHKVRVAPCPTLQIAVPRAFSETERELAASLCCYVSPDDYGVDRKSFLESVKERIEMDLTSGEY